MACWLRRPLCLKQQTEGWLGRSTGTHQAPTPVPSVCTQDRFLIPSAQVVMVPARLWEAGLSSRTLKTFRAQPRSSPPLKFTLHQNTRAVSRSASEACGNEVACRPLGGGRPAGSLRRTLGAPCPGSRLRQAGAVWGARRSRSWSVISVSHLQTAHGARQLSGRTEHGSVVGSTDAPLLSAHLSVSRADQCDHAAWRERACPWRARAVGGRAAHPRVPGGAPARAGLACSPEVPEERPVLERSRQRAALVTWAQRPRQTPSTHAVTL